MALDGFRSLDQYIPNPRSDQDRFFNTVLEELYDSHYVLLLKAGRKRVANKDFVNFLYMERMERWEVKKSLASAEKFLGDEYNESNQNSSFRYVNDGILKQTDQYRVQEKLKRTQEKLDGMQDMVKNQKEKYAACFFPGTNNMKKNSIKQAEWHKFGIDALQNAVKLLNDFREKLVETKTKLSQLYHGIGANLSKPEKERRKKKEAKKTAKEKEARNAEGPQSFLARLCASNEISTTCFPDGFPKHQQSLYLIKPADLKDTSSMYSVIKPYYDLDNYIRLKNKNTFDSKSLEIIDLAFKEKEKYLEKKKTSNMKSKQKKNVDAEKRKSTENEDTVSPKKKQLQQKDIRSMFKPKLMSQTEKDQEENENEKLVNDIEPMVI